MKFRRWWHRIFYIGTKDNYIRFYPNPGFQFGRVHLCRIHKLKFYKV